MDQSYLKQYQYIKAYVLNKAIDYSLSELSLDGGDYWARAMRLNPHDAFIHLSSITENDKVYFGNCYKIYQAWEEISIFVKIAPTTLSN